jgi:hypothetical protein
MERSTELVRARVFMVLLRSFGMNLVQSAEMRALPPTLRLRRRTGGRVLLATQQLAEHPDLGSPTLLTTPCDLPYGGAAPTTRHGNLQLRS